MIFKQSYVQVLRHNIVHFACQQNYDTLHSLDSTIESDIQYFFCITCTFEVLKVTWFGNYRIDVFWSVRYNICFNSHTKFQGGLSKEIDQSEPFGGSITLKPQNNNSIFWIWKGIKRESSDKNRFCVSHEGLPDGLRTFNLL